jgi:hypothetical protein
MLTFTILAILAIIAATTAILIGTKVDLKESGQIVLPVEIDLSEIDELYGEPDEIELSELDPDPIIEIELDELELPEEEEVNQSEEEVSEVNQSEDEVSEEEKPEEKEGT